MTFINTTQAEDPRPFQLLGSPNGILSWVLYQGRPLWLESLRSKDLNNAVKNEADGTEVSPEYLDMRGSYEWMDSMMCVPLMVRGDVRGLYSVELQSSGHLRESVLELLQRLARPLSSLLWNADVYAFDQEKTSHAIRQFLDSTATFSFDPIFLEEHYRAGFIARPFEAGFSEVEEKLVSLFKARGIRARHYVPQGSRQYIIDDIMAQIRNSHFCIADITGSNANVLAEVGMMMTLRKHFILIREKGDTSPPPFNVTHCPLYEYQLSKGEGSLRIWSPTDNRYQSFDEVLDRFIGQLPPETGFFSANEWMPWEP